MLLEIVGAASVAPGGLSDENPTRAFTGQLPGWLAALTLLAIVLGAISANVLNIYSGAMSFLTLGINLPLTFRRALVAVGSASSGSCWPGPGSATRAASTRASCWSSPTGSVRGSGDVHRPTPAPRPAGRPPVLRPLVPQLGRPVAMLVGIVVSVPLFSNQTEFTG